MALEGGLAKMSEQALSPMQESIRDRVERRIKISEQQIEDYKKILNLLDKNPNIEELLNLVRRQGF